HSVVLCHSRACHPHPPSFPTRRSSDLLPPRSLPEWPHLRKIRKIQPQHLPASPCELLAVRICRGFAVGSPDRKKLAGRGWQMLRSEEHTSELQSLTNLVCRLLLEKKNN